MVSLLQEVKTDPLRDTFNRHDKDGNGYLDISEIEPVPPQHTRPCYGAGSRIYLYSESCPHLHRCWRSCTSLTARYVIRK